MENLIEETLSGNDNAYAELIDLIKFDLYNVAKSRLYNQDDIDDAIQETIIKSYNNLSKLENKKYFKTWITRILINECNNIIKSNIKHSNLFNKAVDKMESSMESDIPDTLNNTVFIEELFDKLSNEEKEIANLYFKENLTTEKIAELLHSNKNTVKSKVYRIRLKLKELAIIVLVLCIITTTTVFADDIIEFIISLFTTSRQAIDTAVENDYVQNVDMDFVYDKNIGIKVDYILIDDTNLDVSYVFDCKSDTDITSVELLDYTITDENGNKIYSTDMKCIANSSNNFVRPVQINKTLFKYSNLYTTQNYFPLSNKFIFNIKLVAISKNSIFQEINGNWNFEIDLEDKFFNRNSESYIASYSEYISNISTTINETSLNIDLQLNIDINRDIFMNSNSIILKNDLGENYKLLFFNIDKTLNTVHLTFDIGQYNENIDNLNLYIALDKEKYIDIKLKK